MTGILITWVGFEQLLLTSVLSEHFIFLTVDLQKFLITDNLLFPKFHGVLQPKILLYLSIIEFHGIAPHSILSLERKNL